MASKALELTLISAKDLQNVNLFSRMEVYVVASIDGDPRTQQRTPADCDGGRSPSWNHSLRLPLPSGDPSRHSLRLILRTERALGDRDVGEVHIPLKEIILDGAVSSASPRFLSYQVRKPSSGKAKGIINLSYKITDSIAVAPAAHPAYTAYPTAAAYPPPVKASKADEHVTAYPAAAAAAAAYPPPAKASKADEHVTAYPPAIYPPAAKTSNADVPVTAYPAGPSAASAAYPAAVPYAHPAGYSAYTPPQQYGYAPPTAGYGYAAQPPPQAGYGYPPAGYGYAAQPQPQKKKNKFGMGLGAGLLGGALGGLLIGDMVSDVADYDAGYDAGGGGFDF